MSRTYTLQDLYAIFAELDPNSWEAIETADFLAYLKKQEEQAEAEEAMDRGSSSDQEANYREEVNEE